MRSCVGKIAIICLCAASLAGCGGGSSKPNNTVTQVTVSPSSLSLVAGDVAQLSTAALNSANSGVIATITYTSSNPSLVTVSTSGLVCAGVWDPSFVVCKGTDSGGNPLSGSATITATANGVNSTPVPVAVHLQLSSIVVQQTSPGTACTSVNQTQQYQATACSALATPHDAGPPCGPGAKDITSLVGSFNWTATNSTVGTVDTNGLVTAHAPGLMGVLAKIGNVSSPAAPFRGCMPVSILLHLSSDPAGSPTTSATLNTTQTLTLEADIVDEAGVATNSFSPVSVVSNNGTVATVSGATLTAQSPGGAGILAACIPPGCGANLNLPVYSNLFRTTVNGTSPATTVYATTTFAPPIGANSTVVPIDTSNNTVGTAINLPGPPNSMVFTTNGAKAYIGTTAGLASLDSATNTVTLLAGNQGKVLAVSPDGNTVILSDAASVPDPITGVPTPIQKDPTKQKLVIVIVSTNTVQSLSLPGAVAAAFTNDNFKAFIGTNDGSGNVYVYSPFISLQTINVPGSSTGVTTLPSSPFGYLVNDNSGTISVQSLATCDNTLQASLTTTPSPQAVGSFANNDIVVAVNSTGVDVNTATVATPLTPPSCVPGVSYSNQFLDFGIGAFTAQQLLVSSNTATNIVVLPAGVSKVLSAVAGASPSVTVIPLPAAATEALSGGLTPDGNTAWVGVAGTNTVDKIDLTTGTVTQQIATTFTKRDSTAAPPNLVAVKPK